jgi:hypothetical protein
MIHSITWTIQDASIASLMRGLRNADITTSGARWYVHDKDDLADFVAQIDQYHPFTMPVHDVCFHGLPVVVDDRVATKGFVALIRGPSPSCGVTLTGEQVKQIRNMLHL